MVWRPDFLLAETYHDGYFDFIGNQGWYRRGGARATGPAAHRSRLQKACFTAYDLTGEQRYLHLARAAAEWLLGRNCLVHGCMIWPLAPVLMAWIHRSKPQPGAESVICALLTLLVMAEKRDSVLDERGREAVALAATPPVQAIRYIAAGK